MSSLEFRFLGGFEVRRGGRAVTGFESKRVRALLAYLVLNAHRPPIQRETLAALLWPDHDAESARGNLRQALHNLRITLSRHGGRGGVSALLATRQTVGFNRQCDYVLDVEQFEELLRPSGGREAAPAALAAAVELYRGDLLAGSLPDISPEIEQWALLEQERRREAVLRALGRLIEHHAIRGEHGLGIMFAQRLLDLDPLAEHAHRALMRLYAISGRRSRALAQYETCLTMLRLELGVDPLAETTALYEAIIREEIATQGLAGETRPHCPTIPLLGRREQYARLRGSWQRAERGESRLGLVLGDLGSGKTRLAKALIHDIASRTQTRVLLARCFERPLPQLFAPFRDAIVSLLASAESATLVRTLPRDTIDTLAAISPGLLGGNDRPGEPGGGAPDGRTVVELAAAFERLVHTATGGARPILLFDDLHLADEGSLALLSALVTGTGGDRPWVVATCDVRGLPDSHPARAFLAAPAIAARLDRVTLSTLEPDVVRDIAVSVLGGARDAGRLADVLQRLSGGLPVALAEWINSFCEEGVLVPHGEHWVLSEPLDESASFAVRSFDDLLHRRVAKLPESARRLLSLAAVVGPRFDAGVLADAADEHPKVVDLALETLLERWLVRHFPAYWHESRRERDIVLWSQGARRGSFEFAHRKIYRAVYQGTNPRRRRIMHRRVAAVLERAPAGRGRATSEEIAYHFLAAEEWGGALPRLEEAASRALAFNLPATAATYAGEIEHCLEGLGKDAPPGARERLDALRARARPPKRPRRRLPVAR